MVESRSMSVVRKRAKESLKGMMMQIHLAQQFLGPQVQGHLGGGSYLRALEGLVAWSLLDVVSQLVGL